MDKIICIGKNYLEHAKELGDTVPKKPVIFLKPPSVLLQAKNWGDSIQAQFPINKGDVHHECEIILRVRQDGYQLDLSKAEQAIDAVSIGLDMTLRTLQNTLKKNSHPWTTAKVFKDAAIIGPWIPLNEFKNYLEVEFSLTINKELRQCGQAIDMMMKPNELLVYISEYFPLCKGDIIFTGTPAGVAAIKPGDIAKLHWNAFQYQVIWY